MSVYLPAVPACTICTQVAKPGVALVYVNPKMVEKDFWKADS